MKWLSRVWLHATLNLHGDRLDIDLFAGRPNMLRPSEKSRAQLSRGLVAAGLTPGHLSAGPGLPPKTVRGRFEPQTRRPTQAEFVSEQA